MATTIETFSLERKRKILAEAHAHVEKRKAEITREARAHGSGSMDALGRT